MNPTSAGRWGEELVCGYIHEMEMRILKRNYRFGREEIDIIARDGDVTVFIEVKQRENTLKGLPQEAVTRFKQRAIIRTALGYMKQNHLLDSRVRFDVAAVLGSDITYIKNAFDATGVIR